MPTEIPIPCTLTAAQMPQRLAEIRAIGQAALLSAETTDSDAVLRFRAGADTRTRVEAIEVERAGESVRVEAPVFIVSCGAVNSAALLLRSTGWWFSDAIVWPAVAAAVGGALIWRQFAAGPEDVTAAMTRTMELIIACSNEGEFGRVAALINSRQEQ